MTECELTVEVSCANSDNTPSYRILVDNDLITERTWIWDHKSTFIKEHIFVNLEPGRHVVKIISAVDDPKTQVFRINNIAVNGISPTMVSNGVFILD